jgi:glutamyl-tRNA synthetase
MADVKSLTQKIIAEKTFDDVKADLEKLGLENITPEFWDTVKRNLHSIKESVFWHNILFNKIDIIKEDENFVRHMLETLPNPIDFDKWISDLKQISGKKGKELFHPMRAVLTGLENGPELAKISGLLGYDRIKSRIEDNLRAKP